MRVRSRYSAISRGTEALIAAGRVPESEYQRMRAPFMGGTFPFPVKYGYATVGEVEAGPAALIGRNVFALHPHQTKFDLPAEAVVPVPGDIPLSARGAGGQYRDRAQRDLGRGAGPLRAHRGGRRRRGRRAGRISLRADRRRGGDAHRHRPGARGVGPGAEPEVRDAGRGAGRLRFRVSRKRHGGGTCHRARYRRRRGDHH